MTPEEIRVALRPFNLKAVAQAAGLPYTTVWRFANGKMREPKWMLVDALERYLRDVSKVEGRQ